MLFEYLIQTHKASIPVNNAPKVLFLRVVHIQVLDSQGIFKELNSHYYSLLMSLSLSPEIKLNNNTNS